MALSKMAKKTCKICGLSDTNYLDYGEWKTADNCTIHHFCAVNFAKIYNGIDIEMKRSNLMLHIYCYF